jgi:DNA polymerase III delta subunit
MLGRVFSELLTASLLLDEGKDAKDIEGMLGWNPYKIKLSISAAKKWSAEKLSAAVSRLSQLDAESKSGGVSGYKMIEIFICEYL